MTSQNVEHFQAILDAAARGDFHAEHDFLTVIVESFIEIEATAPLRLANPWGEMPVLVERNGSGDRTVAGAVLELPTRVGEVLILRPGEEEPGSQYA